MLASLAGGSGTVVKLRELVMILELHRQGLTVSAIARELGLDRKTVRRCIVRGLIHGDDPCYAAGAPSLEHGADVPSGVIHRPDRSSQLEV